MSLRLIITFIIALLALTPTQAKKKKSKEAAIPVVVRTSRLSTNDQARYDYFFQGAMIRLAANDFSSAFELLNHCQDIDPEAPETYFYLGKVYQVMGKDSMQVAMMKKAAELQPSNDDYKEALVPVYINNNEIDKAADVIEQIVAKTPERTDMLQLLLNIYNYQKDYPRCLTTLSRLETQEGQTEEYTMAKVQIYTKMNDDKKAYKELQSLVDNHPLDLNYRVMMGNWLLGKNRKKEALKEYQTVLAEEPENESALLSLMDYYRSEGNDSLAIKQREELIFSERTQHETRMLLIKQFIAESHNTVDSVKIIPLLDRVLTTKQSGTDMLELKYAYMSQKNMSDSLTIPVLYQILDKAPDNASARFTLIEKAWANQDSKEMIRLAEPALQFNPDEWSFSYFLGVAYYLDKDEQKCVEALENGTKHLDSSKNKTLATEMYALLGDALHSLDRSKDAYEAYEKCLALDPDKVECLNNYAYYLSEEGGDLDKAAAMSLKTIKAEPSNSTYLDTYAWILYRQGRYEEAKIYIDMAIKYMDQSVVNDEIVKHQQAIDSKLKPKK